MNDRRFHQLKYTVKAGLGSYPSVENVDDLALVLYQGKLFQTNDFLWEQRIKDTQIFLFPVS